MSVPKFPESNNFNWILNLYRSLLRGKTLRASMSLLLIARRKVRRSFTQTERPSRWWSARRADSNLRPDKFRWPPNWKSRPGKEWSRQTTKTWLRGFRSRAGWVKRLNKQISNKKIINRGKQKLSTHLFIFL